METETKAPSGVAILARFFFDNGETPSEKLAEIKALTPEDKAQLIGGITDGTLTY